MPTAYFSEEQTYLRQEWGRQLQHKPQPRVIQEIYIFFSHYEVHVPRFDPVLVFYIFYYFSFSFSFLNE